MQVTINNTKLRKPELAGMLVVIARDMGNVGTSRLHGGTRRVRTVAAARAARDAGQGGDDAVEATFAARRADATDDPAGT